MCRREILLKKKKKSIFPALPEALEWEKSSKSREGKGIRAATIQRVQLDRGETARRKKNKRTVSGPRFGTRSHLARVWEGCAPGFS